MSDRRNRELIDRVLSRLHAEVPPNVYTRIEATLREAAEGIGEHDAQVRLDDIGAVVTLYGRGPTLAQRVRRALA